MSEKQRRADMRAIEELKNLEKGGYCFHLGYQAIYALASRLAALERTVKDYKEAVDAITAWADGKDRQAYEKAIKEIPDEPDHCTCDHETDTWFDRSYTINAKGEWEGPYERCCECGKEKKALPDLEDEPDRAEIVERYAQEVWHRTAVKPEEMGKVRRILNDLLDEVTHERP